MPKKHVLELTINEEKKKELTINKLTVRDDKQLQKASSIIISIIDISRDLGNVPFFLLRLDLFF